jgi:hypothetical protein
MVPGSMMMEVTHTADLKKFVRHELGCQCPDEVFNTISVREHPETFSNFPNACLIGIGGQLLLLLVNTNHWQSLAGQLDELFRHGRQLRDSGGFNRFRLVVATRDAATADASLTQAFTRLDNKDERLHLHVVSPDRFPDLGLEGFCTNSSIL